MKAIEPWKKIIDAKGKRIVGKTVVPLQKIPCATQECNLGNFVADAYVHYFITEMSGVKEGAWTSPVIGFLTYGSIRTNLDVGRKFC